ncbi:uncharacterized protein LOC116174240 [Photinus pyralis]|uniref:uncharacterized protein LOC116174240 n=1 Tax=Photinus pyralis TaxID=7054 RepID=UPI0012673D4F|nr:uncharacterized protein LOC116174240 [Photinus pyralis]
MFRAFFTLCVTLLALLRVVAYFPQNQDFRRPDLVLLRRVPFTRPICISGAIVTRYPIEGNHRRDHVRHGHQNLDDLQIRRFKGLNCNPRWLCDIFTKRCTLFEKRNETQT